jgi:CHAT domain-containing protein
LPKAAVIEELGRRYYNRLSVIADKESGRTNGKLGRASDGEPDVTSLGKQLSALILRPAAQDLGTKRLLIVPDGILQYIPFSALPDPAEAGPVGESPIILKHEVVSIPSASVLVGLRWRVDHRPEASKLVGVFADPVFSKTDPRVVLANKSDQVGMLGNVTNEEREATDAYRAAIDFGLRNDGVFFPRLIYSRAEADGIMKAAPRGTTCREWVGFDANYDTAVSPVLSDYRYLHFASHGLLDSVHPMLSGIVLSLVRSDGNADPHGFLRLNDIYNLTLNADLVTLSACRTALGQDLRGEGLSGLARGFMYAGSTRVMASLWPVNDRATAELMRRFYSNVFGKGLSPATALRSAQVSMLTEKAYRLPFFWAGFELLGDWR